MEIEIRLCKKCHEKGVYSIPISEINEGTKIIEYKCLIHPENSDEKTDFIKKILNKDLIEKLKYCGKHDEKYRYCAWCKTCKKNICYFCMLQEKHDYELYLNNYLDVRIYDIFKELFYIRVYYNEFSPQHLNDINNIINNFELFYELVKEDIVNFQILLNLENNIKKYPQIIENLKSLLVDEIVKSYGSKKLNSKYKGNIIIIPQEYSHQDIEIISLENNIKEKNNYNNNEKKICTKPFIIYKRYYCILEFYDINGNIINSINHKNYINDYCAISKYKYTNILLLQNKEQVLLLKISPDYLRYKFITKILLKLNSPYPIEKTKLIAKIQNNYCLFIDNYLHFIKFDIEKLLGKKIPLEINAEDYLEIINSKNLIDQKIHFMIPNYYDKNKIKIIGISFR